MSHNVHWKRADDEGGPIPPNAIALRTPEDATQIVLQTVRAFCPSGPPGDFNTRARVLANAITVLTSTILRSGHQAVANGEADVEDISASSAHATGMLCQAVADLLTHDVESLVSDKSNPEFSVN